MGVRTFHHTWLPLPFSPLPWKLLSPSGPFSIQLPSTLQHSTRNRNEVRALLPLSVFSKQSSGLADNPFVDALWNSRAWRPLTETWARTFTKGLVKKIWKSKAGDLVLQSEEWKGILPELYQREAQKGMREMGNQALNEQVKGERRQEAPGTAQGKKESRGLKESRNGDEEQNWT